MKTSVSSWPGIEVETEGHDRHDLELPGHQLQLLQDAVKFGKIDDMICFARPQGALTPCVLTVIDT